MFVIKIISHPMVVIKIISHPMVVIKIIPHPMVVCIYRQLVICTRVTTAIRVLDPTTLKSKRFLLHCF